MAAFRMSPASSHVVPRKYTEVVLKALAAVAEMKKRVTEEVEQVGRSSTSARFSAFFHGFSAEFGRLGASKALAGNGTVDLAAARLVGVDRELIARAERQR